MTTGHPIDRYLTRHPGISALVYVALVVALVITAVIALLDIGDRRRALDASADILARLEGHAPLSPSESGWAADSVLPAGSPFLEGQTVTMASAALMQRITSAITAAGGNVVSSEVDPQGTQSKDGYVRIIARCEIEQEALQQLLYDIEAGMPFLFIDQFLAQASLPASERGRLRVLLGISGLWPGTK